MSKNLFKSFLSTLLALMMIVTVAAIPSSAAAKLSKSSISLTKGYSTTLSVSGSSSTVTWSTGNKSIATVSSKGKVVGKGVGSTYIYAKTGSSTLKCKVTVVAGKISVGTSSVEMEPGETVKVKIKAMGTHTISVKTMDKSVVSASWAGAKFSGDYVNLTLKAVGAGSARVKVYAKNYPNSIYKYIDVDVIGDDDDIFDDDNNSSSGGKLQSSVSSVTVAENATQTFTVYASDSTLLNNLRVSSSSIWGFGVKTAKSTSKNALLITVSGYSAETGTIKIYSSSDSSISVTIPVTVTAAKQNLQYYTLLNTRPTSKILQTDTIITYQNATLTYYMLVPYGYDPAYANTVAAKGMNFYSYNLVYDSMPQKKLSNDQIVSKNVLFNGTYQTRYVLAPYGYDEAFVNTVFAKYSGTYEYYVVYTEKPIGSSQLDRVVSWTINKTNAATGRTEVSTRYLLCPYNYDQTKIDEIKNKDMTSNIGTQAYTVYSTPPYPDTTNYTVLQWTKLTGENRYMIVPKTNCDYVKRNDTVRKDVGYFSYYVAYSEAPTVTNTTVEAVYSLTSTTSSGTLQTIYVLYNPSDADWQTKVSSAINGNAYIGTRQGTVTQ